MHITVVGAGLSGPLLAQGLRRAGIDVLVHERDEPDRPDQGYRIAIAPEGDLALRSCLPPSRYQRVLDTVGKRGSGWRVLDPQLRIVQETLVPTPPDEERTGRHLTVDRQTLRRILLDGLDVRYRAPFERYELLPGDRVRAHFGDGTSVETDLLVGADGTHSRVRPQLLPDAEIVELGQTEIFGKTRLTGEARRLAPPVALDGFCVITGPDGRFMPLAAHEFRNGGDDYLMWVVAGPSELFPAELSTMDKSDRREHAARLVADWHPSLAALVRLGDPATVGSTTIRTAKPVPHWETVPVTLLGDAAHTMVPQGTSAAVALRDAGLLCRRITERGDRPLLDSVAAYETEMLEYGFAEVARSLASASS
ncbi:FAD-dependent oxidoreductase [Actinocatenispora comari]|uniref:Monooxygenase n=1 Tax=Actinocatenispora comari TaxID=2807577 RepID=A0A8J4AGB2_9ACTN|nr:NAD(P)/FAD-dependent oxidoreductase [Actinocatenispora comari]GIL28128.1 monooxygenase [Actinocatenispora comari]